MLVGRVLQGFGAALIAVGISVLRDELPPERICTAVALMSATMGIGSAVGLPLAGILTDWLGWHSVFWFGAAEGVVLMAALVVLVEQSPIRTPGRFDIAGAVLLSATLVCLLLTISQAAPWGWSEPLLGGAPGTGYLRCGRERCALDTDATVFDFAGDDLEQRLGLTEQLTADGRVTCDGQPASEVLVALSKAMGKQEGPRTPTRAAGTPSSCRRSGGTCSPAYDPRTDSAQVRKASLGIQSAVVDVDLPCRPVRRLVREGVEPSERA